MRPFPSARAAALLVCLAAPAAGCDRGDDLLRAIDDFEQDRARTARKAEEVEARYAAQNPQAIDDDFADEWEDRWDEIESEVKKLKKELAHVVKAGNRHFRKIDEVTRSLKSPEVRRAEAEKNAELTRRWSAAVRDAQQNVQRMEAQVVAARDLPKVLKLAAMRSQAEDRIAQVRHFSGQVRATAAELERLTAEGRALVR